MEVKLGQENSHAAQYRLQKVIQDFLETLRYAVLYEKKHPGEYDAQNLYYLASNIFDIDDSSKQTIEERCEETTTYNANILNTLMHQPLSLNHSGSSSLLDAAVRCRKQNDPTYLAAMIGQVTKKNSEFRVLVRDLQEIYDELR